MFTLTRIAGESVQNDNLIKRNSDLKSVPVYEPLNKQRDRIKNLALFLLCFLRMTFLWVVTRSTSCPRLHLFHSLLLKKNCDSLSSARYMYCTHGSFGVNKYIWDLKIIKNVTVVNRTVVEIGSGGSVVISLGFWLVMIYNHCWDASVKALHKPSLADFYESLWRKSISLSKLGCVFLVESHKKGFRDHD